MRTPAELARRGTAALERLADDRAGVIVLAACALAVYALEAVAWPLIAGRDVDEYLAYYLQLGDNDPTLPAIALTHTPLTPIFDGVSLDLAGGALAEPLHALCFAVSVVAWAAAARVFGRWPAIVVAVALLIYPAYGALFHELSSEALYATGFALWVLALVRTTAHPTPRGFVVLGGGVAVLTLIRPGSQVLAVAATLLALVPRGSARHRLVRAFTVFAAAAIPLAGWAAVNGLRYGEYTIVRGARGALFQHALVVDQDVEASNGPNTRKLIAAIRSRLLTRQPYRAYHLTLDDVLSSGSLRASEDIAVTAYELWGWDGGPALLDRVGGEAIRAHQGTYVTGVLHTVWLETSEPYYRPISRLEEADVAPTTPTGAHYVPPPSTGENRIPGGQNAWIARPDHGIRQVWTSPTTYRFTFATSSLKRRFEELERQREALYDALPRRSGSSALVQRLNQLGRWYPRPLIWLGLGLLALALRRPARWPALLAPALAAAAIVVVTALVAPPDVRYVLPVAPAAILLAAAALLGSPARWRARSTGAVGSDVDRR
jgi:hypothetical protein